MGLTLGRPVESNLRMWFHFYIILGNEAIFPIEFCLVPVLITFFIQNLKRNKGEKIKSFPFHTLKKVATKTIMLPFRFVYKRRYLKYDQLHGCKTSCDFKPPALHQLLQLKSKRNGLWKWASDPRTCSTNPEAGKDTGAWQVKWIVWERRFGKTASTDAGEWREPHGD